MVAVVDAAAERRIEIGAAAPAGLRRRFVRWSRRPRPRPGATAAASPARPGADDMDARADRVITGRSAAPATA